MSSSKSSQQFQQKNILDQNNISPNFKMKSYKKSRLLAKLKTIIPTLYQNKLVNIKILSRYDGFTLENTPQNINLFSKLINQLFSLDIQTFNSELISMGFRIINKQRKNQRKTIQYKYYETFMDHSIDRQIIADQSEDQSINDKLQEKSQKYMRSEIKQQQQRSQLKNQERLNQRISKRSNIILNKFKSQGVIQSNQLIRSYQDISLQANLPQNQYFSTPLNANRTIRFKKQPLQQQQNGSRLSSDHEMSEKISSYKQNYQKCSKLIDNTILKILNAHRSNTIDRQSEMLLNQITQIYDIMSDNIQNVNSTLEYVEKKEKKELRNVMKENQILSSPGFKPINQDI